jgi:hypothetical protein
MEFPKSVLPFPLAALLQGTFLRLSMRFAPVMAAAHLPFAPTKIPVEACCETPSSRSFIFVSGAPF